MVQVRKINGNGPVRMDGRFKVTDIMANNDHGVSILHPGCTAEDFDGACRSAISYISDNVCGCTFASFALYDTVDAEWCVCGYNPSSGEINVLKGVGKKQ